MSIVKLRFARHNTTVGVAVEAFGQRIVRPASSQRALAQAGLAAAHMGPTFTLQLAHALGTQPVEVTL